jgi:hypothetical protein
MILIHRFLAWTTLLAISLTLVGRAPAQTITVTTTSTVESSSDALCTLPEAVTAINNQASFSGCSFTPSSSADRIVLNASGSPDVYTIAGPMTPTRTMEIVGQGRTETVISTGGVWGFRAQNGSVLGLTDLTLQRRSDQSLPVTGVRVDGGSSLELDNVRVTNFNQTGIIVSGSSSASALATIVDSTIDNNTLGGLSNARGSVEILNSIIRGNTTTTDGGGIRNFVVSGGGSAHVEVYDSLIESNLASRGGGIYSGDDGPNTKVNVTRSLIRNNVATDSGGGYYSRGQFIMNATTVTQNWANVEGAGIYHNGAEFQIQQCTIVGNGGPRNGFTTQRAGGVFAAGGNRLFVHSIVAQNLATASPDVHGTFLIADAYNIIGNTSGSTGFMGTDLTGVSPMLGALRSLGGPTMVMPPLAGSPAIDRIPSGTFIWSTTDQRGSPRQTDTGEPRNGDDASGAVGYDVGAFEQGAIEAEFLTVAAKTSNVTHSLEVMNPAYSKSEGTRLAATADGHFVTYAVPVLSTGTYSFRLRVRRGNSRGIYQVATANSLGGAYTSRGSPQDLYATSTSFTELTLGGATVTFATTGTKYLRFTVTGKNAAASGRNLYLDWIQLVKQ